MPVATPPVVSDAIGSELYGAVVVGGTQPEVVVSYAGEPAAVGGEDLHDVNVGHAEREQRIVPNDLWDEAASPLLGYARDSADLVGVEPENKLLFLGGEPDGFLALINKGEFLKGETLVGGFVVE